MELITPDFGLLFWMTLAFGIVFFILAKFAFPVINGMLKKREEEINNALELAERTHKEMEQLQSNNEALLQQAREERDKILNEAKQISDKFIEDACKNEGDIMSLEVRMSNQSATRLYEKCGFTSVGKRERYYADGEDALLMTRNFK